MTVTSQESRAVLVAELGVPEHTDQTCSTYRVLGMEAGNVLLRGKQNHAENTGGLWKGFSILTETNLHSRELSEAA